MDLIAIGRISKPIGIRGEVKILPYANDSRRFLSMESVWIGSDDKTVEQRKFLNVRIDAKRVIASLDGITTVDEARKLRNHYLFIPKEEKIVLRNDSYFVDDVIGCEVETVKKVKVGVVKELLTLPANDVWVVDNGTKEILIPAVKAIIQQVDVKNKRIIINAIEGLLE